MTIYAGHQVTVAISETFDTPSYATLKGLRECNWRIEHIMQEIPAISDDAWLRLGDVTKRLLRVSCRVYGASHTAQARIRAAMLEAGAIQVKVTLADDATLEGAMQVERYEEFAREDELLEVEIELISAGEVTVSA